MTATPARDALVAFHSSVDWDGWKARHIYERAIDHAIANPSRVIAALVEAGWRPTADDLRKMGGMGHNMHIHGPWCGPYCDDEDTVFAFPEGVDGD